MGTVKYTGPVASFHCPTNAEIRSLKVHFSPKQEGSGDPSPSNVRSISGWTGVSATKSGKNLFNSARPYRSIAFDNTSFITSKAELLAGLSMGQMLFYGIWTPANTGIIEYSSRNGVFAVLTVVPGATYYFSGSISNGTRDKSFIKNNVNQIWTYDANLNPIALATKNSSNTIITIPNNSQIKYLFIYVHNYAQTTTQNPWTIDDVINSWQVEKGDIATSYESYQGSTTAYEFGVLGKNKFDKNGLTPIGAYIDNSGNLISSTASKSFIIPVAPNTQYTISKVVSTRFAIGQSSKNIPEIGDILTNPASNSLGTSISFTTTATTKSIVAWVYIVTDTVSYNDIIDSIQLELGSTTTTYEPYNPNHTVYGGWVDLITGEITVTHEKAILNGDKVFNSPNEYNTSYRFVSTYLNLGLLEPKASQNPKSNWLKGQASPNGIFIGSTKNVLLYLNKDLDISTKEALSTYLTEHPLEFTYELTTPIIYHLAPTQLQTFLGQNNVWSNADYVEVEYDLHETQTLLQRKAFIMANQPHIESASGAIASFKTDLRAPVKECKAYFSPVQDLHGYSNPWPAGGGKNIAKPYDNSYVSSTYVSFDYSAANGTFRCYGTASDSSTHASPSATNAVNNGATFTLPAGTYTLSIIDGDGANIYAQCVSSTETVLAETTSYTTFTTNESLTVFVRLKVAAAATVDKTVKIQLERGSSATTYEPYENICSISGWSGLAVTKCGKNLVDDSKKYLNSGNIILIGVTNSADNTKVVKLTKGVTYRLSAKIASGKTCNGYYSAGGSTANSVFTGATGNATGTFTATMNAYYSIYFYGSGVGVNDITDVILTVGTEEVPYEPYTSTTIPVTFPATKNLFDEKYENISFDLTYKSLYVGNNVVTASSDIPLTTNNYSNLFILPGQVSSGASTGMNNFNLGQIRTVTPIDGYVTIGYRNMSDIDPRNYHVQIEQGSVATAYEPYGTIYGGYVDLVSGEVWKTWDYVPLDTLKWERFGSAGVFFNSSIRRKVGNPIYSNILTPTLTSGSSYSDVEPTQIYYYKTNTTYKNYLMTRNTDFAGDLSGYRQWIKDTYPGAIAVYELETPVLLTTLTPTQLKTLRGTNNIWSNTNGNISTQYWVH